jgi:(p)ppGpp synthase/HD superfamily hydrolase
MPWNEDELLTRAKAIAEEVHGDQVDRSGKPYLGHVRRVAARLDGDLAIVGWLHDVVEDSTLTIADLAAEGFPEPVLAAVDAITHRRKEPLPSYWARVKANEMARQVKLVDIADNLRPERLALLDGPTKVRLLHKYARALLVLVD